jgi:hypothetical protein
MNLSTMSLGRFMRDMFGDQAEPWLTSVRNVEPELPRESTISNTNNSGKDKRESSGSAGVPAPPVLPSQEQAASTVLDLPRGSDVDDEDVVTNHAEDQIGWNAKSYPTMQPSLAMPPAAPPEPVALRSASSSIAVPTGRGSNPALAVPPVPTTPAGGSQQIAVPAGQFPPGPGSGSSPAHGATPIASTRHGYASAAPSQAGLGAGSMEYPRYEPPADDDPSMQLRPNRRPLFIGLGLTAIGIVLLVMTLGGGKDTSSEKPIVMRSDTSGSAGSGSSASSTENALTEPGGTAGTSTDPTSTDPKSTAPTSTDPKSTAPTPTDPKSADPKAAGTKPDDDKSDTTAPDRTPSDSKPSAGTATDAKSEVAAQPDTITIDVTSDPDGADVILAGKVIGTTPLKITRARSTGLSMITVHKARYADVTTEIDLSEDYTSEVKLKTEEPEPADIKKSSGEPKKNGNDSKRTPTRTTPDPKRTPTGDTKKNGGNTTTNNANPSNTTTVKKPPACQTPAQYNPLDERPLCK